MNQTELLQIFKDAGALLEGHFLLSSSLHSGQYLQCARVLENPQTSQKLCRVLAENFKDESISAVVGPAMGGIILAYELARALGVRALFTERESGKMCLRRGFSVSANDKVLIAEDVITTGGSVKEVIEALKADGTRAIGVAALIDRSGKKNPFGDIPLKSLARMDIETYSLKDCPLCKKGIAVVSPGSRK